MLSRGSTTMDAKTSPREKNVGQTIAGTVGSPIPHDSAHLHVSGEALYTDDIAEPRGILHLAVGMSTKPHARIRKMDLGAVLNAPGVVDVMSAAEIPGANNCGPVIADDPIFAPGLVEYVGQSVFAVAAETVDQARKAARLAKIDYDELEPILDPRSAVAKGSFVLPSETMKRGDSQAAMSAAPNRLQGSLNLGGQDQFYLEGQIATALPTEDGDLYIVSSTQHPGEVQHLVSHAIAKRSKDVVVECRRMGGAFGGKESQPALIACIAGLMADKTGRACKLRLDRDDDMIMTGKRHDFVIDYEVGFDDTGRIGGIEFMFASRCGMSADLSGAINDRTMFHCDNAYYLENVTIVSHRCKTNTVSNTAFRGFGGPQGMFAIEYVVEEIARYLGKDPLEVRRRNFYGIGERDVTQYQQKIEDNIIDEIVSAVYRCAGRNCGLKFVAGEKFGFCCPPLVIAGLDCVGLAVCVEGRLIFLVPAIKHVQYGGLRRARGLDIYRDGGRVGTALAVACREGKAVGTGEPGIRRVGQVGRGTAEAPVTRLGPHGETQRVSVHVAPRQSDVDGRALAGGNRLRIGHRGVIN